jgi:hypothetical protein
LFYWGLWATLAVIALLLRYVVGSATHLSYTYVTKIAVKEGGHAPESNNLCLLFVDILFLIAAGILAVLITRATDNLAVVMRHSIYFIAAGFIWSLLALMRPKQREVAWVWLIVDGLQITITIAIFFVPGGSSCKR